MARRVTVTIPYGRQDSVCVELPQENLLEVLEPRTWVAAPELRTEVRRALAQPIHAPRLHDIAHGKQRVVILADDITRLTPAHVIVPQLLDELNAGGIADRQAAVLIALGTHRAMSRDEVLAKFGAEVLDRVTVLNHDCRDSQSLVDLGTTPNGTPVRINRLLREADLSIGVGSVYPHHIPGFAGGSKIVQPGASGEETTAATHLLGCRARPPYLGQADNPVRREMDAVARQAGVHLILNTVQNASGQAVAAFYGDLQGAFRGATETSRAVLSVPFTARADIVIAGSYPADLEFWQAHKALYPAEMVAKPGGTLIIVTPCPEGVSGMHPQMLLYTGWRPDSIDAAVRAGRIADGTAAALAIAWAQVRQRHQVSIVSGGLSDDQVRALGFVPFSAAEQALDDALRRHGPRATVTVLPRAPETLPVPTEGCSHWSEPAHQCGAASVSSPMDAPLFRPRWTGRSSGKFDTCSQST